MESISTYIYSQNKRLIELISLYFEDFNKFRLVTNIDNILTLCNNLPQDIKPLIFLDMETVSLDSIDKIKKSSPNSYIVAITDSPDVSFIVSAVKNGVKDILPSPIIKVEFIDLIKRIEDSLLGKPTQESKCKMITIFSNKGGIGKTSIATNIALELAQLTKEKVALIDLNFQFGDVVTFMDLHPTCDITNIFESKHLLNEDFLISSMEKYKDTTLYVLADTPYLKNNRTITTKQLSNLYETLKSYFTYVIVDTEANFEAKTITTLDYSDIVFLVTIVNIPALRNCQRCLELFSKLGYNENKVKILINRFMENDDISIDEVEKFLRKKIYWKIPNNYFALMAAINKGILLSEQNPTSNVAQNYKEFGFAMQISDSVYRETLINKYAPEGIRKINSNLEIL